MKRGLVARKVKGGMELERILAFVNQLRPYLIPSLLEETSLMF
jgi:hypothetical protein